MAYTPDPTKGIEVYVDADFVGGWDPGDAMNADNVYSRNGYVIWYAGCPIYWQSKLQTEIALSTAEAEYIALSQALRGFDEGNQRDFSSFLAVTKVCHQGQRGQLVMHCDGAESQVLSSNKTHCN